MALYFKGNAPTLGLGVFDPDTTAIVYYLPETTGWGPTFGGLLAVPWNPQAQIYYTPLFQFAIFYNSLLEFTWCAPFTVKGRTHANGNIYTGPSRPSPSTAWSPRPARFPLPPGMATAPATIPPRHLQRQLQHQLPAPDTAHRHTNLHAIIYMPPNGEDPNSALGQQRYYNKADIVLLVSNSTVTLTLKTSACRPRQQILPPIITPPTHPTNYVQVTTNFPFLTITNTFTDQRESDTVKVTDIDVGHPEKWLATNAPSTPSSRTPPACTAITNAPNILYAADNRTYSSASLRPSGSRMARPSPPTWSTSRATTSPAGSPWRRPTRFMFGATTIVRLHLPEHHQHHRATRLRWCPTP